MTDAPNVVRWSGEAPLHLELHLRKNVWISLLAMACAHTPVMPGPTAMVRLAPPIVVSVPAPPVDPVAAQALARAEALGLGDSLPSTSAALMGNDAADADADMGQVIERLERLRGGRTFADKFSRAADHLVGTSSTPGFRRDCSGFVAAAADRAGLMLGGGSEDLWATGELAGAIHHRKVPDRGDIVFFDRTWDRDGNGRFDDMLTHVGVVVGVNDEGTIRIAHRSSSQGLTILHMNLLHPDTERGPDGQPWNDGLRAPSRNTSAPRLSGQLWRGFATLLDEDLELWSSDISPNGG